MMYPMSFTQRRFRLLRVAVVLDLYALFQRLDEVILRGHTDCKQVVCNMGQRLLTDCCFDQTNFLIGCADNVYTLLSCHFFLSE